jgi:hypothetical protein
MIDTTTIPAPKVPGGLRKVHHKKGVTKDIISVILETDRLSINKQFCAFAKENFTKDKAGLKRLWSFVKYKIQYVADDFKKQDIKEPAALWHLGVGDCKSKTIFIDAVLRCLGIPYTIRFTTNETGSKLVKHVYSIAHLGNENIIMDSVWHHFNHEPPYQYKEDYPMTEIAVISGPQLNNGVNLPLKRALPNGYTTAPPWQEVPEAVKKLEVIKQKQAYIPEFAPIAFNKLTEGQAALDLASRQLKTLEWAKPQYAQLYQQAQEMVHKELKNIHGLGGGVITGVVPFGLFALLLLQR